MPDNTALPTRRPLSTRQKTISILLDSSVILALGAFCYVVNDCSLNFALSLFDHMVNVIETPREKKKE
jgi:hypothetical protein